MKKSDSLSDIISKSFKEYGTNWKSYLGIIILLSFIPSIIFFIIGVLWLRKVPATIDNFSKLGAEFSQFVNIINTLFTPLGLLLIFSGIITFLFSFWMYTSIIYKALSNKKLSVGESLKCGGKYFFKYLGLIILLVIIFLVPIFLIFLLILIISTIASKNLGLIFLLIIFAIFSIIAYVIFVIYLFIKWALSSFILIAKNSSIINSLKESSALVKGRWWKTFGYLIVFGLIIFGISLLFSITSGIINIVSLSINDINSAKITMAVNFIFGLLSEIIIIPLGIIMGKNLYLSWKSSRKTGK